MINITECAQQEIREVVKNSGYPIVRIYLAKSG